MCGDVNNNNMIVIDASVRLQLVKVITGRFFDSAQKFEKKS